MTPTTCIKVEEFLKTKTALGQLVLSSVGIANVYDIMGGGGVAWWDTGKSLDSHFSEFESRPDLKWES